MKRVMGIVLAILFVMSLCVVTQAAEQVERSQIVSARATIAAINPTERIVTLKGPEGNTFDVKVGEEVRNFSQLKVGDEVNVRYYQSLLVQVAQPGQQPMASATQSVERAAPGEKPRGVVTEQINTTAKVMIIDKRNGTVTLQGPSGNVVTVKAMDPSNLDKIKVGDTLNITYTQAMAISVEKARG